MNSICEGEMSVSEENILRTLKTNLQHNLAEEALSRSPDLEEEHCGMDGGEQGTIEPATTLRDKLRNLYNSE